MADKFDEFVAKTEQKREDNIDGVFDCQSCDDCVGGAFYDPTAGTMEWTCKNGHVSRIKAVF